MKKDNGFSAMGLIITIIILLVLAFVAVHFLFGNDGIVNKLKNKDTEYNKTEVVEQINLIIKQKYFGDSKYALENKKDINEIYNETTLFQYLIENNYIEQLKDINDNVIADQYFIKTENLNGDIVSYEVKENGSEGNGTKVFKIKKVEEKYMIYFVDKYGKEQELGELIIKPEL